MSKIKQIEEMGYKIHKGWLFHGEPQPIKDGEFYFYIETPSGELYQPYLRINQPFYVGKDKLPCTRLEIIQELYNPSEEDLCYFENKYDVRTKKYLDAVAKDIHLVATRYDINYDIKNDTTKPFKTNFVTAGANISEIDNHYYVQLFDWNGELMYTFEFSEYPNLNDFNTAYDIEMLKVDFHIGKYSYKFICRECGQEVHWLDGKGSFQEKINHLEDCYCGCC